MRRATSAVAVLAIERTPAGHAIAELRRGARVAPRLLDRGPGAVRATFVPTQAGPLAGDRDSTRIVVGAGATLVVEPVAATLALPGAPRTLLRLDVTVHEGGRLVLDEGPLIVAAGADVRRSVLVELEHGAVAALRETVVLGRDGEPPGTLESSLRVTLARRPLLHDGLRVGAASPRDDAHVALAPGHRVVATIALLGVEAAPEPGVLALEGAGALQRAGGASLAAVDAVLAARWRAWVALVAPAPAPAPAPATARR
ncbi:MAG: urease accessory protein [Solirubrobacteraceae bacterium]|nr:urease accessory protein [Solirubrobacteraceae bacterium]